MGRRVLENARSRSKNRSYLGAEDSRLHQLERLAVDPDQALAGLALSDSLIETHHSVSQKCVLPPRGPYEIDLTIICCGCSCRPWATQHSE